MSALSQRLDTTIRPRLLVESARYALDSYDRQALLPRLLGLPMGTHLPRPGAALDALIALEHAQEAARKSHGAGWRAARHVAVITAMLYEAQCCAQAPAAQVVPLAVARQG